MPPLFTAVGPFTVRTFTLALTISFLACAGVAIAAAPRKGWPRRAVTDACIAALAGAVFGARLEFVLLNRDYYADNLNEALRLSSGGLSWHGAVIGGLIGLLIAAKLRRLPFGELLDTLTPAPALLMLCGWYACWSANGACGYGAEVDTLAHFPSYAVSEAPDIYAIVAPRYNTQAFGVMLALVLLVLAAFLMWRGWLKYRRFWLLLALASVCTFFIGFWRGDPSPIVRGLRLDQWLDAAILILTLVMMAAVRYARIMVSY